MEGKVDYKMKREGWVGIFIFQIVSLSWEILFYFWQEIVFLKSAWPWLSPGEDEKKNVCSGRSLDMLTKLRPARFFFRQNKYLIKNIKIFHYINSKYMCTPIFWALKKSMWDLHYFERNWRKVEKVVEFRTFYGTCHSHKQRWEE